MASDLVAWRHFLIAACKDSASPASISVSNGCAGSPHARLAITGIPKASARQRQPGLVLDPGGDDEGGACC